MPVEDPQHTWVCRHVATLLVIHECHRGDHIQLLNNSSSRTTVPNQLHHLCNIYNFHHLSLKTDLALSPNNIWKIKQRRLIPPIPYPNKFPNPEGKSSN